MATQDNKEIQEDNMFDLITSLIDDEKNIFLTGSGGVGKSYYIHKINEKYHTTKSIYITSTTGVSAHYLKGQTIHSFSGLGAYKGTETNEYLIKKVGKNKQAVQRIRQCEILVIDEISMMGKKMLEALDFVTRTFRRCNKPFGGMQLIFTGDFLQLPPVQDQFAFLSETWDTLDLQIIYLKKVYRFKDQVFAGILERVRMAKQTKEDVKILYTRVEAYKEWEKEMEKKQEQPGDCRILPTFMYSRKVNVEQKNMEELDKNPNRALSFPEVYSILKNKKHVVDHIQALEKENKMLTVKVGAQVMLNVNIDTDDGLVNGSRGVVTRHDADTKTLFVRFLDGREMGFTQHPYVIEEEGEPMYQILQYPFVLAYALSIHKTQGATLDYAIMDLGFTVFENSMSYVALSRVRSLDGLFLKAFQPSRITCDKDALAFYEELEDGWE